MGVPCGNQWDFGSFRKAESVGLSGRQELPHVHSPSKLALEDDQNSKT